MFPAYSARNRNLILRHPALIEGWDCVAIPLSDGGLSTWTGVKGTVANLIGGSPFAAASGYMQDANGVYHPMVALGGATRMNCPIGGLLSGRSRLGVIMSIKDFTGSLGVLLESDPLFTSNGKFGCTLYNVGDGDIATVAYGGGNYGQWLSPTGWLSDDPTVIGIVWDFATSSQTGMQYFYQDGVEVEAEGTHPVTNFGSGSTIANTSINFGGRNDASPFYCSVQAQKLLFIDLDNYPIDTFKAFLRVALNDVGLVGP